MPNYKLSPSDFGFLWAECRRCFYLKVVRGFPRPALPFPRIFNAIDEAMKARFAGKRTSEMAPGMPPGVVHDSDQWVESVPISRPGRTATAFIKGIYDTVIRLDDGGYAVVDFKTSSISPKQAEKYGRQLEAYALALENAGKGGHALAPVTGLGLLVYDPGSFATEGTGTASLGGRFEWLPVKRDGEAFLGFLDEVLEVLDAPEPPPPGPGCEMCRYRERSRRTGL